MNESPFEPMSPERAAMRRALVKARRNFKTVQHYADRHANQCPDAYRDGRTPAQWLALDVRQRQHLIRCALTESYVPLMREAVAADPPPRVRDFLALSPADRAPYEDAVQPDPGAPAGGSGAEASEPSTEGRVAAPARYTIAAACCGEQVPRTSPRPAIVFCQGSRDLCPTAQ